ncbi:nucleotide exchange factor GrpE [Bacillus tianshenii]|nr:nucleotide exchange factor GrpE [Bacillus tianshenii]
MAEDKLNQEQEELAKEAEAVEEEVSVEETQETDELAKKQAEIEELQAKVEEYNNRYLRAQADMENFRRRVNKEREADRKYRAQSLIEEVLPALDNFGRALAVDPEKDSTESVLKGMQMVHNQLIEALKKEGLEEIEAVGKEFDPQLHQAVMQVEDENYESNVVVEELQRGYKLNDRVIRPSMVKVNQ